MFEVESDYDEEENNDKLESAGGTVPTIQPTTYSISPNICAIAIADYGTVCVCVCVCVEEKRVVCVCVCARRQEGVPREKELCE